MEATTPPNTTGFSRKPKNRKLISGRKPISRKSGSNPFADMPAEAKAWFFASMFLVEVAKALAPVMGFSKPTGRNSESATV